MPIQFSCTQCHKSYTARSADAGKRFACKSCNTPLQVPPKPAAAAPVQLPPPVRRPAVQATPATTAAAPAPRPTSNVVFYLLAAAALVAICFPGSTALALWNDDKIVRYPLFDIGAAFLALLALSALLTAFLARHLSQPFLRILLLAICTPILCGLFLGGYFCIDASGTSFVPRDRMEYTPRAANPPEPPPAPVAPPAPANPLAGWTADLASTPDRQQAALQALANLSPAQLHALPHAPAIALLTSAAAIDSNTSRRHKLLDAAAAIDPITGPSLYAAILDQWIDNHEDQKLVTALRPDHLPETYRLYFRTTGLAPEFPAYHALTAHNLNALQTLIDAHVWPGDASSPSQALAFALDHNNVQAAAFLLDPHPGFSIMLPPAGVKAALNSAIANAADDSVQFLLPRITLSPADAASFRHAAESLPDSTAKSRILNLLPS